MTDKPRLLLVEDDESIALGLRINLEAEGFEVESSVDGALGLRAAENGDFDLVLLDVMLPRINGFDVLRRLRDGGNRTPVVLLTARGTESEKVMGLELGAQDYITKPFGLAELLARVRAILRRNEILGGAPAMTPPAPSLVRADTLEIDPAARTVRKANEEVELTATEFDILWCLASAQGRAISRADIQAAVWGPGHHGTLRTIDNFILQLRAKLEEDSGSPKHLLTVRGVGYRFSPE